MLNVVDRIHLEPRAKAFKELVMDVLVGTSKEAKAKRGTLLRLAPGDWRIKGRWDWERIAGETEEQILDLLFDGVVPLLWGHAPFEFPRSRWTGSDRTFEDIGVPCNIHDVQLESFKEFRAMLGEAVNAAPRPFVGPGVPAAVAPLAPAAPPVGPAPAALGLGVLDALAPVDPAGADALVVAGDAADADWADKPRKNKAHRTNALEWLFTDPGLF